MRKMTCKKRSVNQPSRLFLFLCTAPTLILTVYFILVPTLKAFVLSFTDSTMLGINVHFVGLDNYAYMFHDKNFLQAMGNTLKLMLIVPICTLFCSLLLAFAVTQCRLKEKSIYRV